MIRTRPGRAAVVQAALLSMAPVGPLACGPRHAVVTPTAAGPPPDGGLDRARETVRGGIVGPGDILTVRVFQEPDLSGDFRVEPDGTLSYPFLGPVPVKDRTPTEVAGDLQERLSKGYLVQPVVSVFVKEFNSRKVYIFGQVKTPGTLTYTDGMTIIQAITLAGGFTSDASRNRTSVARTVEGAESRITVPIDRIADGQMANFALMPGDIVYVPESPI